MSPADAARLALLRRLAEAGYQFTTPSPSSHCRVLRRRGNVEAANLAEVFGWNLRFGPELVGDELMALMQAGEMLKPRGRLFASRLRVASVGPLLFLHSAFPPRLKDTVFFGPDSYRFTAFLRAEMPALAPGASVVDIGAGSGVGGLFAHATAPQSRLTLTDVNPLALRLARINATFAGVEAELRQGDGLAGGDGQLDLVVANPPYVAGTDNPIYCAGGGGLGAELSLQWAKAAMARLAPGGRLLLYTGSAIVRGRDALHEALEQACGEAGCDFTYRELDADVFPELLRRPVYWPAERIAAVGAVAVKPR